MNPRYDADDDQLVAFCPMPAIPTDFRELVRPEQRRWGDIKKGYTHFADGDVVVAKITPCFQNGKSCVMEGLRGVGAGTTELHVVSPFVGAVTPKYMLLYFKSPGFIDGGVARMTGTAGQQRVPRDYFASAPFPLPPIAEQHRIVTRIDELMGLLDRLEAARSVRDVTRVTARSSVLNALSRASATEVVGVAWRRLAERMDDLLGAPADIAPMRQAVLELALRGRLAAQDSAEEPAKRLLERAVAEKARLAATGAIRGGRLPLSLDERDEPFPIPREWVWCRAESLLRSITSGSRGWSTYYASTGPLFLRIGNLDYYTTKLDLTHLQRVQPPEGEEQVRTTVQAGDVLISITGDTGMVGVVPENIGPAHISQHVAACRPLSGISSQFLALAFTSTFVLEQLWSRQRGIKNSLGLGDIAGLRFPLPPHEEQRRIVARVEQLMGLLDRLEEHLVAKHRVHAQFAAAVTHAS